MLWQRKKRSQKLNLKCHFPEKWDGVHNIAKATSFTKSGSVGYVLHFFCNIWKENLLLSQDCLVSLFRPPRSYLFNVSKIAFRIMHKKLVNYRYLQEYRGCTSFVICLHLSLLNKLSREGEDSSVSSTLLIFDFLTLSSSAVALMLFHVISSLRLK